jgi:diguanylate cyclase (GGDEF)-like protein
VRATPEPVTDPVAPAPKLAVPVMPKQPPAPAAPPAVSETPAPRAAAPEPPPALRITPPLPETPAPATATPAVDGELGDIDLVEQMLHDRAHVRDMALRLIASQTGWRDVACVADGSQVTPGYAAAPVELNGKRFGLLTAAAPAGAGDLAAWAAWLARWLALESQVGELHDWAFKDELTGVCSRRYFNQFLDRIIQRAIRERFRVTLMVFDIDNFKSYNDRFGHAAGDDILRETARLMQSVVRPHDVVARIGGDEFAVIFWDADEPRKPNSQHPDSVRTAAERFQKAVCAHRFPKLAEKAPGTLTISGGLAGFPWDGRTPEELLELADQRAMQSKRQGKNAVTFGPGVDAGCDT